MQTIYSKSARLAGVIFLLSATFLTACEKDVVPVPEPTPFPPPVTKELKLQFSNTGIPITDVDSVVVVVRDPARYIKKWQTMTKATTSFSLNLDDLPAGNYTAEIYAYSKTRADLTARQYALTTDIVLPLQQAAVVNSPTGSFADAWYQRAIFRDGATNTIIIVAMDPRDSFYEIRLNQPIAKNIHLQRYSIDVNAVVASRSYIRDLQGLVGCAEYSDFIPFVQAMNGKSWTKAVISGWVEGENGGDIGFDYEYYY
jgi:hypothetical protein